MIIANEFCEDCKYYDPIDLFVGKCLRRDDKCAWVTHPACDKFERKEKGETK